VEIVAALFVEGIDFRQVAGPATRIDITGAFFSTVVDAYRPARTPPGRARAGADGLRRQRNAGNGVPARRRRDRPEPPDLLRGARKFGYRLVKGELDFPEPGTIEACCTIVDEVSQVTVPLTTLPLP